MSFCLSEGESIKRNHNVVHELPTNTSNKFTEKINKLAGRLARE